MQIQNYHFTMHLLILLRTYVMLMVLHSRKVRIILMCCIFFTHHAITEQLLVEPSLDLCLSQYDSLPIHSDKKEFCDNAYVKLMNPHALCVLEPNNCVESRHVVHIAGDKYELKLLSSLKTLGYIKFDDLCNLSDLMLICHRFLNIHIMFFGKYNNKDQYMMQRVYI